MIYEYSGYLKTILDHPDPAIRDSLPCILFTADDIAQWSPRDAGSDPEWRHVPSSCRRVETALRIEGHFNDVRQIDNLAADDPSIWTPLSTLGWKDPRLPIDVSKYPVAEITYRCTSANAFPAWQWTYPGGVYFDGLAPSREWRTIARRVQHNGFPQAIEAIILRLYATVRATESFEVEEIRFRALSEPEAQACRENAARITAAGPPKRYPLLDTFMPIGCYMSGGTSKRLAAMLGIAFQEYWALAFEDMVKHHHNCVVLEDVDRLTEEEWRELLTLAEPFGVKFIVVRPLPLDTPYVYRREFIHTHVTSHINSPSVFAWNFYHEPPEHAFAELLDGRRLVEEADPDHPMSLLLRSPNEVPLVAPLLPALGIANYGSHEPWRMGEMIRAHLPLCAGQQLWAIAPAFIYATDTPEWHTCPEMRLMMNHAFANGARGWFTFSYHNDPIWTRGSTQRTLTGPFLAFSDLWSELGLRAEHLGALAPIFLGSRPDEGLPSWFSADSVSHTNAQLPEGVPPCLITRFLGDDFDVFCIVSNDVREMASVYLDIGAEAIRGRMLYDLSDYVRTRRWAPMEPRRHLEMFPAQMHVILVAPPEVCWHWRDVIAARMIASDRQQLFFDMVLARSHGIDTGGIEDLVAGLTPDAGYDDLDTMRRARDAMINLVYDSPAIYEARTKIIKASAAVCACDGSLCRLLAKGKSDLARQWGFKVVPLAREFTNLRLELRRGRGAEILGQCEALAVRAGEVLAEIRALT